MIKSIMKIDFFGKIWIEINSKKLKYHRIDGPACIWNNNGNHSWYLTGKFIRNFKYD